jgi:hypothetical protein
MYSNPILNKLSKEKEEELDKICSDGSLNARRFEETETGSERRDMEESGA